jgi:hypothetical protein
MQLGLLAVRIQHERHSARFLALPSPTQPKRHFVCFVENAYQNAPRRSRDDREKCFLTVHAVDEAALTSGRETHEMHYLSELADALNAVRDTRARPA